MSTVARAFVEYPSSIWAERDPETGENRWFSIAGMGVEYVLRSDVVMALAVINDENALLRKRIAALEDSKATLAEANSIASAPAQAEALPAGVVKGDAKEIVDRLRAVTGSTRRLSLDAAMMIEHLAALSSAPAQEGRS